MRDLFAACEKGDAAAVRTMLAADGELAQASLQEGHGGWTALHSAAKAGQVEIVRLLLEHGADPNAREKGDHTTPLHWAAAGGKHVDAVRALLDAGADVHGSGDLHEQDVIGWATYFHDPAKARGGGSEVLSLLLERGARHHIFSALSVGDPELVRQVVRENPRALDRRMSRFENRLTALHLAASWKRYDLMDVLIELGADLEAVDGSGQTPLESAMLNGDREAVNRLQAAGAKAPRIPEAACDRESLARMGESVTHGSPMIAVPDVAETLEWYKAIGFREMGRVEDDGVANWGWLAYGRADFMLMPNGKNGRHETTLWFYTDEVERLYEMLKAKAMTEVGVEFVAHLYEPFYGGKEFGIRDLNGYQVFFRRG